MTDSSIPKFFEKSHEEKLDIICNFSDLNDDELNHLKNSTGGIDFEHANKMIENAIGTFSLPLGIATNFKINDNDYLVPMVIEEPSVIAAASKAAKIAKIHGGFTAKVDGNISIGQIQVLDVNIPESISTINSNSNQIIELANSASKTLPKLGKGAKDAILYTGTKRYTQRMAAALKGIIDAGLKVPADAETFPSDERINGEHLTVKNEISKFKSTIDSEVK